MSLITIDQLDMAVPMARYEDLAKYIDALNEGMERFEINTPQRIAAFVAQIAHESGDFRYPEHFPRQLPGIFAGDIRPLRHG